MKNQIVAIYCRLSKEDLDKSNEYDNSESIQNQKSLLIDYALDNNYLIYNIYIDEDLSGFADRPAFKQMIHDASEKKFNIVLCKHQSRFTRDMEIVEKYIHGLFVEWGIRFISLTDNVDTNIKGNKKARQIHGLINEWYSEDLSENIRTVFKKKMQDGQFLGAFACYGYAKDPNDRHKLIIDEEAASIVRKIFFMYLNGYGNQKIATTLTQRGILTPTEYKQSKGFNFKAPNTACFSQNHGIWSPTTIKRILTNETYTGTLIQARERKISYKSKKVITVPKEQWIIVKNNHEAIIEKTTFDKVQKLLKAKRKSYKSKYSNNPEPKPHILAGKVKCANCGSTMQRSGISRNQLTYYLNCKLASKTKRKECSPRSIRQDHIEKTILESINSIINNYLYEAGHYELKSEVANHLSNEDKNTNNVLKKQIAEFSSKIDTAQKNIVLAYKDKLSGLINDGDFVNFKALLEGEMDSLIKRKKQLEEELVLFENQQLTHSNIKSCMEKYQNIDKLTHEIINDFIDTICVDVKDSCTKEQAILINWTF
ncbi:MAG: recombinase family protein [Defluviitaleaceae bacterium]|nr:recombinase family protein [Defluviitaleaceae bacterium]